MDSRSPANGLFSHWLALCLLSFSLLAVAPDARATVLTTDSSGQATGVAGLDVLGVLYDVSFVFGDPLTLFTAATLTFTTDTDAETALNAIVSVLNAAGAPALATGSSGFRVPHFINSTSVDYATSGLVSGAWTDAFTTGSETGNGAATNTYAIFTSATAVPGPASFLLLLTGLGSLAAVRRGSARQGGGKGRAGAR